MMKQRRLDALDLNDLCHKSRNTRSKKNWSVLVNMIDSYMKVDSKSARTNLYKTRRLPENCESMAFWGKSKEERGRVANKLGPFPAGEKG